MDIKSDEIKEGDMQRGSLPSVSPAMLWTKTCRAKYKSLGDLLSNIDSVDALILYLKAELPDYSESISTAFRENNIDGHAFQSMTDKHFRQMNMNLTLGQRLHLLQKTRKVRRAARHIGRGVIIQEGECLVSPPGVVSNYQLTQSYLRFTHTRQDFEPLDVKESGIFCCTVRTTNKQKTTVRYVDHVDISLIDDMDISEEKTEKTEYTPALCPCSKDHEHECEDVTQYVIYISLNIKSQDGLDINDGKKDGNDGKKNGNDLGGVKTGNLRVCIKNKTEAYELRQKLQDLMNEHQHKDPSDDQQI